MRKRKCWQQKENLVSHFGSKTVSIFIQTDSGNPTPSYFHFYVFCFWKGKGKEVLAVTLIFSKEKLCRKSLDSKTFWKRKDERMKLFHFYVFHFWKRKRKEVLAVIFCFSKEKLCRESFWSKQPFGKERRKNKNSGFCHSFVFSTYHFGMEIFFVFFFQPTMETSFPAFSFFDLEKKRSFCFYSCFSKEKQCRTNFLNRKMKERKCWKERKWKRKETKTKTKTKWRKGKEEQKEEYKVSVSCSSLFPFHFSTSPWILWKTFLPGDSQNKNPSSYICIHLFLFWKEMKKKNFQVLLLFESFNRKDLGWNL